MRPPSGEVAVVHDRRIEMLHRIVSGGQTGADRAALDAGLALGFPVGGYCPRRRKAEDGPIDAKYPLEEVEGGYSTRTLKNVETSDGTAIFYESMLSGGTEQTLRFCIESKKPYKLLDIGTLDPARAAEVLAEFIRGQGIDTLNVAGPRASGSPRMYAFVYATLSECLHEWARSRK